MLPLRAHGANFCSAGVNGNGGNIVAPLCRDFIALNNAESACLTDPFTADCEAKLVRLLQQHHETTVLTIVQVSDARIRLILMLVILVLVRWCIVAPKSVQRVLVLSLGRIVI